MLNKLLRRMRNVSILVVLIGTATFSGIRLDAEEPALVTLPVTTINGRECFYYKPKSSSETVYGLSKRLGLTREEIVAYNPAVADGIRRGTTLYFPVEDFQDRLTSEDEAPQDKTRVEVKHFENPLTPPVRPMLDTAAADRERKVSSMQAEQAEPYTVAILLPFMLDREEISRPAKLATDFYKGFLIAADTLSSRGEEVKISVFDTEGHPEKVRSLLADSRVKNAAAVVLPESPEALTDAAKAGLKGEIFNILNFSDTLFVDTPNFVQANIPHRSMYRKAVDYIMSDYSGMTPVILTNSEGRNDKEAFTAYLRERLSAVNKPFMEISYDGTLTGADLDVLLGTQARYCVIPSAGSIGEFNRFAHALKNFKVANPGIEAAVFGYPEWTTFRGEALDMLHTLEATIYSRFSADFTSFAARTVNQDFRRWYGSPMIEGVPSQGLLGYDAGCYIIKNLRSNRGQLNPAYPADFRGIQSSFRFVRAQGADGGWLNEALYIIHYKPLTGLDIKVL